MSSKSIQMSSGEVCTLNRIKQLGIESNTDILDPSSYVRSDSKYQDLKTFNAEKDNREGRIKSLCKEGIEGAYPHCIDEHGPGFIRKPGEPNKCITVDCPPGFTKEGSLCDKKPMFQNAGINKQARCDERWYDWFLTPNYHLGNKYYQKEVGVCYAPCPPLHVPNFGTDPIDKMRLGFTAKDELDKCVNRADYFLGKYAEGTDYCPLAWIARINATQANVRQTIERKRAAVAESYNDRTTDDFNNAAEKINETAQFVYQNSSSLLTNIDPPKNAMLTACKTLQTPERLREAYNVCKRLQDEEQTTVYDNDQARNLKKIAMMKQACNAVFCNEENFEATDFINQDPLCFKPPPKIDPETGLPENKPPEDVPAPTYDEERSFITSAVKIAIGIILFPLLLLLLWFAWRGIRKLVIKYKDFRGTLKPSTKMEMAREAQAMAAKKT